MPRCRCRKNYSCWDRATQEDGLCDFCRHECQDPIEKVLTVIGVDHPVGLAEQINKELALRNYKLVREE